MQLADALIEAMASVLFGWLTVTLVASLRHAGTLTRRNPLALALTWIFAASALHRLLHAWRLASGRSTEDVGSLMVDALILVGLGLYAVVHASLRVGRAGSDMALVADWEGLRGMQNEIHAMRGDLAATRGELALEKARMQVFVEHLRQSVEPVHELRQVAQALSTSEEDQAHLVRIQTNLQSFDDLVSTLEFRS